MQRMKRHCSPDVKVTGYYYIVAKSFTLVNLLTVLLGLMLGRIGAAVPLSSVFSLSFPSEVYRPSVAFLPWSLRFFETETKGLNSHV